MAKKYNVHFSGFYGFDIEVEAESKEQAEEIAEEKFFNVSCEDYAYEAECNDIWEIE